MILLLSQLVRDRNDYYHYPRDEINVTDNKLSPSQINGNSQRVYKIYNSDMDKLRNGKKQERLHDMSGSMEWTVKALTDIWTGSADSRRLITTGLIGSIRWWFEVLVRGMGGYACDPTIKTDKNCEKRDHCVVCELFGCTGWARKFRFDVVVKKDDYSSNGLIEKDEFTLRFIPLRHIRDEEWILIDATLRLIAEFGAIGGKTVLKPSDEKERGNKKHHRDYGMIKLLKKNISVEYIGRKAIEKYLNKVKWLRMEHTPEGFSWASMQNFWFVDGKTLSRQSSKNSTYNRVIGRKEDKNDSYQYASGLKGTEKEKWLAGSGGESSKKIFSFKKPPRTYGFIKPNIGLEYRDIERRLQGVWGNNGWQFVKGDSIIDKLFNTPEE